MKKILLPLLGVIAIAATGCSGGGAAATTTSLPTAAAPATGYPSGPPSGTTTTPSTASSVVFTITVPTNGTSSSSAARRPDYVSTGTQSVKVALTMLNGSAYSATPAQTKACTSTCSLTFAAVPVGVDGFTVTTYNSTVALQSAATALSTDYATATVVTATTTSLPMVLDGIPAAISSMTFATTPVIPGTAVPSDTVSFMATDAAGKQIIGSAPFVTSANITNTTGNLNPITLTTNDTLGAVAIVTASLPNPGSTGAFSYSGLNIATNTDSITASAPGVTPLTVPIPVSASGISLSTTAVSIDATPATLSAVTGTTAEATGNDSIISIMPTQIGWGMTATTHPFTTSTTCPAGVLTITNPSTDTFVITSGATASAGCNVTFTGGAGATAVLAITQTASGDGVTATISGVHRK